MVTISILPLWGRLNDTDKNWLYFKDDLFINEWYPFTISQYDKETGYTKIHKRKHLVWLAELRGSAGPIQFEDGYITLVHEVNFKENNKRCYYHRIVYHDSDCIPTKMTDVFYLEIHGVQYASGMNWFDGKIGISYTIEDTNPRLMLIDPKTIVWNTTKELYI